MKLLLRAGLWLSVSVSALALAVGVAVRLTAPPSGSMKDLYSRVQVGMSRDQAVAALQAGDHDYVECIYVSGTDRHGQPIRSFFSFNGMPPDADILDAKLAVTCNTGESVEVTLGEGGVVTAKRYLPNPDPPPPDWVRDLLSVLGL